MNQRIARLMVCLLLGTLVWAAGCSGASGVGTVSGQVTLDSEPLKEGVVRFVPVDGKSQTSSAVITNGTFTATVPVGTMRVEFSASRVLGRRKVYDDLNSPTVEVVGERIAERFNVKSELRINVRTGRQSETFNLSSQ
jgi:hypothetical protein